MTILFFTRLFYPHIGGVEKHLYEISKRLITKKHKVIIVTEQFDTILKQKEEFEGIQIYRIPVSKNWFKKFEIWQWLFKHREIIKKADVVHCHDVFYWYLPFKFLFPTKKVFTTFHGYENYPIKKRAIIVRKISELLSNGNICVGEFITKWYKTKPTYVIYGGANKNKFKVQSSKFKVGEEKLKIFFVGRLDEHTGILIYIQALKLLKEKGYEFALDVFGDGRLKVEAENFCKKNKLMVTFKGFQSEEKIDFSKYRYAFVSRYLSILEAFSARKLVFAVYDNAVKEDYLLMTPFANNIVIVSSSEEIASKVLYFLKHFSEEKKLIEKSFTWAKKQTWNSVLQVYLKLWSS